MFEILNELTVLHDKPSGYSNGFVLVTGDLISHTEELDQNIVSSIVSTVEKYCLPASPTHSESQIRCVSHNSRSHTTMTMICGVEHDIDVQFE